MTTSSCGRTSTTPIRYCAKIGSAHCERGAPRGNPRLRGFRWHAAIFTLMAVMLVVSGCAGTGSVAPTSKTPAASAPTATTPLLLDVTPGTDALSACTGSGGTPLDILQIQVGTFDSWQELPEDLPLRPETPSVAKVLANIALNAVTVDIALSTPRATAPGYLCAVTARIIAYRPLATPISNVTRSCSDHAYLDPGGPDYGGDCGVLVGPPASAGLVLPSSQPGTAVSVPVKSATPGRAAMFPSLDGRAPGIGIELKVPASGTYVFVIGLWQDSSGPIQTVVVSEQFDLGATHEWSGQACAQPDMQGQLPPPTNPPTLLFCPGSAPAVE